MFTDSRPPDAKPKKIFKNPLLYSSAIIALVLLVVVWIMASRWLENRRIEHMTRQEQVQKQRENDVRAVESLGGNALAIQSFYASPGAIRRGEAAQLCYDVSNAKDVKLDPPVAPVWPSHSRCMSVSPKKNTTYTLTIADAAGNTKTAWLQVTVR
jgi:hypothetical protein